MIGFLKGTLVSKHPPELTVDVGGVGYEINVAPRALAELPGIGEDAVLHTHLHVREDAQALYGFASREARDLFRLLIGYLSPVLPATARAAEEFMRVERLTWDALGSPLLGHEIAKFKPLMTRVEAKRVQAMIEASKEDLARQAEPARTEEQPSGPLAADPINDPVEFPDFAKVDRIVMVACGTAFYACQTAKYWFEKLSGIPVEVDIGLQKTLQEPAVVHPQVTQVWRQVDRIVSYPQLLRTAKGRANHEIVTRGNG